MQIPPMQRKPSPPRAFPLQLVLIAPFVIQIVAAIGITGWISYQNGQQAIRELASGLLVQAKYRVKERLNHLLLQAQTIAQANAFGYQQGQISLDKEKGLQEHFWHQISQNQPPPFAIYVGDERGKFS